MSRLAANGRMQIRPGAQVIAGNDLIGKVSRLVYRPDSAEVAGIIVTGWIVLGHDIFVPIEAIERTEPLKFASGVTVVFQRINVWLLKALNSVKLKYGRRFRNTGML